MSSDTGGGDDITLVRIDSGAAVVWRSGLAVLFVAAALGTIVSRLRAWALSHGSVDPPALVLPISLSAVMLLLGLVIGRKGEGKWPLSMTRAVMRDVVFRGPQWDRRWARRRRRRIRLM